MNVFRMFMSQTKSLASEEKRENSGRSNSCICPQALILTTLPGLDVTYQPTLAGHIILAGLTLGPVKIEGTSNVFSVVQGPSQVFWGVPIGW